MPEDDARPQPDPWSFPAATTPVDAIGSDDSALPPSSGRSDRVRRGVVTAAVVVLALGAAGAAGAALARSSGSGQPSLSSAAATSSPSASSGEQGPGREHKGKALKHLMRGGPGMLGGALMGLGGALHGQLVVSDGNGGYKTVVVQRGKATSVSTSSITVKSDDGFTQTYAVSSTAGVGAQRDGLSSITKGANVVVTGEKKGSSVTADHVLDMDAFARGLGRFGGGPGDGRGPGAPQPAPNGTASTGTSSFGA